jgi:NADP-reducing hydrogenase subunit HndB
MKLEDLKKIREQASKEIELRQKQARIKIVVGMGTSGIAAGARDVIKVLLDEIATRNLTDVMVTQTGEKGLASHEPMIEVHEEGKEMVVYGNIDAEKAKRIIAEHIVNHKPVSEYVIAVK